MYMDRKDTRPCTRVHGTYTAVYTGRIRAMYTAVSCSGPIHESSVYMACTWPSTGRVHVYTARRRPWTQPAYTARVHSHIHDRVDGRVLGRVHGRVQAVYMGV